MMQSDLHLLITWFKKHCWQLVFITSAIAAIVFNIWHFFGVLDNDISPANIGKAIVSTAQLFVLGVSINGESVIAWQLVVAAVLAPFSTIGAILLTWGHKIARWLSETLMFSMKPADYIFIGGDESAAGIASRFAAIKPNGRAPKIVGLDLKNNHALPHTMRTNKTKGFMRTGDALNDHELDSLLLHKTKNIYITTGNDLQNIEIARRIHTLCEQNKKYQNNLYVHVRDHHHIRTKEMLIPSTNEDVNVQFISIKRMAARAIFHKHPPIIHPSRAPHVLIIGTSELAQCLLLHTVQHCITHETKNVTISWVGKSVSEHLNQLRQQYIGLGDKDNAEVFKKILPLANIQTFDCDEDEFRLNQWQQAQTKQSFDIAYVACEHDDHTISASLRAASLREVSKTDVEIVACLQQSQGSLKNAIQPSQQKTPLPLPNGDSINKLYAINIYHEIIQDADINYPGEHKDYRAMIIQAVYDQTLDLKDLQNAGVDLESIAQNIKHNWAKESKVSFNLQSSRLSADHLQIKQKILEAQGIAVTDLAKHKVVREKLAKIEHKRFIAERLIQGWLPLPDDQISKGISGLNKQLQKQYLLSNHTLVAFNDLELIDREQRIDQQAIDHRIVASIAHIEQLEQALKAIS